MNSHFWSHACSAGFVFLIVFSVLRCGVQCMMQVGARVASSSSDELILEVCSAGGLVCSKVEDGVHQGSSEEGSALRDASIVTINDLQEDFFLESALVEGRKMALSNNLRDPAPRRAFLTSSAAEALPVLATYNVLDVMKYYGVARDSSMATSIATAAYLCGSAALPGEARSCVASTDALAAFVTAELGHNVKVYATRNAPTSAPKIKAPVTISNIAKGSIEEGQKIVVCHHIAFPSTLYYCHRVTGTKVVQATLNSRSSAPIHGVGICHINTALWLSRHPAFAALKIARGEEACHWIVENDLVFTPAMPQIVE
jgi:hypothetical protein